MSFGKNKFGEFQFNASTGSNVDILLTTTIECSTNVISILPVEKNLLDITFDSNTIFNGDFFKYINLSEITFSNSTIFSAELFSGNTIIITAEYVEILNNTILQSNLILDIPLIAEINPSNSFNAILTTGNTKELSCTISSTTTFDSSMIHGSTLSLSSTIQTSTLLDSYIYNISPDTTPVNNYLIWNGEESLPFVGVDGNIDSTNVFRDVNSFRGAPTAYKRPGIILSNSPSFRSDISDYTDIIFFATTDHTTGINLDFEIYKWPNISNKVNTSNYIVDGTSITNDRWKLIKIPIANLINANFNATSIEILYFGKLVGSQPYNIFIDEIYAMDDSDIDIDTVPIVGKLPLINMGETYVYTSLNHSFDIKNIGLGILEIYNYELSNTLNEFFIDLSLPNTILPSQSLTVNINYVPSDTGIRETYLTLYHNRTPFGNSTVFKIIGSGANSQIVLDKYSLDFGTIPTSSSMSWDVKVDNSGNSILHFIDVTSTNNDFSFIDNIIDIEPENYSTLSITYNDTPFEAFILSNTEVNSTLKFIKGFAANFNSFTTLISNLKTESSGLTSEINSSTTFSAVLGIEYSLTEFPGGPDSFEPNIIGHTEFHAIDLIVTKNLELMEFIYCNTEINSSISTTQPVSIDDIGNNTELFSTLVVDKYLITEYIDSSTIILSNLSVEKTFNNIDISGSTVVNSIVTILDSKLSSNVINGKTTFTANMKEIKYYSRPALPSRLNERVSVKKPNYPWQHNDVYSDDIGPRPLIRTYTVEEFNAILLDKANKVGVVDHGNIALLDEDGDIIDSGIHPDDLVIDTIDNGVF